MNIIRAGQEAWALREGREEAGNEASLGRPLGNDMLFLEGMVKYGVEAEQLNPGRRQGLRLVVWVQLHLCFIDIPGNGFQVTGCSPLSLEPRP